jgi:hypothetical protein
MPLGSWLFLRHGESIWVERPSTCAMMVAGPGRTREEHAFPDERALEAYQVALADRLAGSGWFLWGVDRDRRAGRDRRSAPRSGADRRQPPGTGPQATGRSQHPDGGAGR